MRPNRLSFSLGMSTTAETKSLAPQLVIGATFTAAPAGEPLAFWLEQLKLSHQVEFAPYQQVFQWLLDPASSFAANRRGANIVLVRLEDLHAQETGTLNGSPAADLTKNAEQLLTALQKAAESSAVPVLFCLCPESAHFLEESVRAATAKSLRRRFQTELAAKPNIHWISLEEVERFYGSIDYDDPLAERAGHVPYRPEFFAALATLIARKLIALERKPYKVIALDCDNTLWTGVCGEDGPLGVQIDQGRRAFHEFLLKQQRAGVLLAITSKNNEQDVKETFELHPDILLRYEDFVAHRINWEPKSNSLLELSHELNLSLDSFIFLDDDAKECAEVRENCPEVLTLKVSDNTTELEHFLQHVWAFDLAKTQTKEDASRTQLYAEQVERARFEKQAKNLQEFLAGLQLEIVFAPVTPETLPRVAQLTQRTNQMNTSLIRRNEGELQSLLASKELEAFTVTASDRFGHYGLVGMLLYRWEGDRAIVDTFLLSCRALGRGVEHRVLAHLAEMAVERKVEWISIPFTKGPRNQPAEHFLTSIPEAQKDNGEFRFRAGALKNLQYPAPHEEHTTAIQPSTERKETKPSAESVEPIDYEKTARELSTIPAILEAISLRRKQGHEGHRVTSPPQTELERQLATIWCDLLGLDAVGIDEDFFDLGGHSLLAVQLLSRVHRDLGIDLPDSVIYSDKLRIAELARTVELFQLGVEDQAAYDAMLAEIDSLSDEEVAALLEKESAGESSPHR